MIQKKIEFPPKPQPEHIELLIEFLTAFQRIPQKYCMLCRAKTTRLGIDGHKSGCPLRRAFNFVKLSRKSPAQQCLPWQPGAAELSLRACRQRRFGVSGKRLRTRG
jgi:hypothetical protein